LVWWLGDSIGVVLFAPFLLVMSGVRRAGSTGAKAVEAAALLAITALSTYLVFRAPLPLIYLLFVPLVWASLRFEQVGAACMTVVLAIIAVVETVDGRGPFSSMSATSNLVSLQIFNASVGFTSLVLAAVMRQRTRAEYALRSSEERYRKLFEQAHDLVCVHDTEGNLTYVNTAAQQITGYSHERLLSMNISELVAPEHLRVVRRTAERQLSGDIDATTYEVDVVGTSGRRVSLELSTTVVQEDDETVGVQLIGRDITSRKLAEDRLRQQALHDELTGLPNRTLFRERLEHGIALAKREGTQLALVMIDVDHLKAVNDTHHHRVGDELLKQLGARLADVFRDPDTVARIGGDEFALVLPALARGKDPSVIGEQLHGEIGEPFRIDDATIAVSASVGIAMFPQHAGDAETMAERADYAMLASKRAGGAVYSIYRPEHDSQGARRFALLDELHAAIENQDLLLFYQPKIAVDTMQTVGVECLVRWRHPRLGPVAPMEFIPLAEASGLMPSITSWVLREALRRAKVWLDAGIELTVAVNVSRTDLQDGTLIDRLRECLNDTGIPPDRVIVEVAERNVVDIALHSMLKGIGAVGVQLSVDDFGTSSSSMVHLRRLEINEIKVDRSFVGGATTSKEDEEIARQIIQLGHNIGVPVVAEGVETRQTWDKLAALGCDQAQGNLICKPVGAAEFESWLRTPAWSGRVS
jgi:diguanylate cyclase (GGDEF)-like protein/PAS domain S-box-containing protein